MRQGVPIGTLAKATDTKVETIRYYESIGLLPAPARTAGNYRSYEAAHIARLGFIRRSRDLGFSIPEVRELLRLNDDRERSCGEVDAIARNHVADIERKMADLQKLRDELLSMIGQCRRGKIADCRILDSLAPALPSGLASEPFAH
jgi:Cu(I)-responsive transcriptional regulator